MNRLLIARVAHEVNRAYCAAIGDTSQLAWADAPEWQRASVLAGVDMHVANPNATPEQSHESWLAQKQAEGWIYGEVKDPVKKEHPCVLPYAELPTSMKAKDYLFRGVVHALHALPVDALAVAAPDVSVQPAVADLRAAAYSLAAQGELVKYIGADDFLDRLYGSKLSFAPGQTRRLPGDLATRFLRHADMFERGAEAVVSAPAPAPVATEPTEQSPTTDNKAEAPAVAAVVIDDTAAKLEEAAKEKAKENTEVNQLHDMLDQVNNMDKDALKEFASVKFNQAIPKTLSLENMRAKVAGLVEQFGAP